MENVNEAETIFSYIFPQLSELGWDRKDIQIGRNYHDIKIFNGKFIIEAKKFGALSNTNNKPYKSGVSQLQEYLLESGLTVGCLTDGESWFWVTTEDAHKIDDLTKLSKVSICGNEDIHSITEVKIRVADYCGETFRHSVKATVPNGHILTTEEINTILA